MKELLTSLRSSRNQSSIPEKSFTPYRFHRLCKNTGIRIVWCLMIVLATGGISFAQTNEPGSASVSTVLADPVRSEWKSYTEYSKVITAIKTDTENKLADPNLTVQDRVLYTGFDRMLTYIQSDLQDQDEVGPLADKNYKKVLTESQSDPALQNLPMADFNALYDSLVVKLHH